MSWCKNNGDNRLLPAPVALSCQLPRTYEAYNCCISQSCFFAATNLNLWDGCQSIQSQGEFDPKDAQLVTISVWGCLVPKDVQSERAFNFKNSFCKFWGRHCFIFSDIKNLCQDTFPPSYHWWWCQTANIELSNFEKPMEVNQSCNILSETEETMKELAFNATSNRLQKLAKSWYLPSTHQIVLLHSFCYT